MIGKQEEEGEEGGSQRKPWAGLALEEKQSPGREELSGGLEVPPRSSCGNEEGCERLGNQESRLVIKVLCRAFPFPLTTRTGFVASRTKS